MRITVEHHVSAAGARLSPRAREVAAMFGLTARLAAADEPSRTMTIVPRTEIDLPVPGPGIVLITGPSGSGKSTLLRLIAEGGAARGVRVLGAYERLQHVSAKTYHEDAAAKVDSRIDELAVIDLIAPDRPLNESLELLSLAGLGDAFIMLRRPHELSDGQRLRFRIAQMMFAAAAAKQSGETPPTLLAIDEFAATLDRLTARTLARNLRRWSDRSGIAIVLATSHDDLIEPLAPDVMIRKGLGAEIDVTASTPRGAAASRSPDEFHIQPGTLDDYRALARFHYRSHHPGAATSVLRMVMARGDEKPVLVGVLVRSLPHLNLAARDLAVRNRYATLSPRERGIALNREIRCISRVVIDPRFRGTGLAVRLVRHAMEHPESGRLRYTEAVAAMGRVSPFFERAGMRRFDLPEACRPAHARLLDALQHAGLTAHDLSRDESAAAAALDHHRRRWLVAEARRFLRATRRLPSAQLAAMSERDTLAAAGERLLLQPVYYLHAHTSINHATSRDLSACTSR